MNVRIELQRAMFSAPQPRGKSNQVLLADHWPATRTTARFLGTPG
jgi:hypothetical protein